MPTAMKSKDAAWFGSRLRPWEWGSAKNDRENPRNPDRIVTAGHADDLSLDAIAA